MKRSKRIYLLLGVLAVICAATFAVLQWNEEKEQIKTSGEVVLEVSPDSVESLAWEYEDVSLAFHRGDTWLYDEDEAFPVDQEKMEHLLEEFAAFRAAFIIEEVEDFAQYGLDNPVCTIHLTTEEQSYEILLGDYSQMDSQRYVSFGDGNVYLAASDPLDAFRVELSGMIKNDEIPYFDQVSQIQFSGAENYSIFYEEDSSHTYSADDLYFTQQEGDTLPLDTDRVEDYLYDISSLTLDEYVTYNATADELSNCGLDDPELTVTVDFLSENGDGEEISETFVLHVSRDPEERAAAEASSQEDSGEEETEEEEEITAYARIGDSQIVYQISSDDYLALKAAAYDDLRHQEVLWADFQDITQVDITLDDTLYTITAEGEGEERVWRYQEEEVEIDDFQSALESLSADSFTDEQPTQKEEIRLTVHLENENFPQVEIILYRYDGASCLAVVDNQPVSLVSRSSVVDLMEAVHAIVLNES